MSNFSEKIKFEIIVCPFCKNHLLKNNGDLYCSLCDRRFPVKNGVPNMMTNPYAYIDQPLSRSFEFNSFIRNSRIFKVIKYIFGADFIPYEPLKKFHNLFFGSSVIMLNLGSGSRRYPGQNINVDIEHFPNVDILADGCCLPFLDNTFDAVISDTVIEHVKYPNQFVAEIKRVLKKDGTVYITAPFIHPFHSYPGDYQRYSVEGLKALFEDFTEVESGIYRGPSVAFVNFFSDYLAGLFSFFIPSIHFFMKNIFTVLIFPIKFLDIILNKSKKNYTLAHSVYYIGKK